MSDNIPTRVDQDSEEAGYRRGFVTKHQVTGWRFVMRRIASGIALHDTRMFTDPLRTQTRSVLLGVLIVITGLIGCFIYSLLRPSGAVGNNTVLADRDSSALYVRVNNELHSVLNLTSARLIVGRAVQPAAVSSEALDRFPRGMMVGIPGAPERMVQNASRDADWTVCDSTGSAGPDVTVIAGQLSEGQDRASALPPDRAVLVDSGPPDGAMTWLLWDGRRSLIDLNDRGVTDALGLPIDIPSPRPIAPGLFNAIPEGAPLHFPSIPGAGTAPQFSLSEPVPVGGVIATYGTDGKLRHYAVLPDGLQMVSPVVAAMLRNTNSYGLEQPPSLGADEIARSPVSRMLDTSAFPAEPINLVNAEMFPVTCVHWAKSADAKTSSLTLLSGAALPIGASAHAIDLPVRADDRRASRVVVPVGRGYFVQTVGQEAASAPSGSLFWISDTGIRYGIEAANQEEMTKTVAALGLAGPSIPAPWSVLTLLTPGPALSKADALSAYVGKENP